MCLPNSFVPGSLAVGCRTLLRSAKRIHYILFPFLVTCFSLLFSDVFFDNRLEDLLVALPILEQIVDKVGWHMLVHGVWAA